MKRNYQKYAFCFHLEKHDKKRTFLYLHSLSIAKINKYFCGTVCRSYKANFHFFREISESLHQYVLGIYQYLKYINKGEIKVRTEKKNSYNIAQEMSCF